MVLGDIGDYVKNRDRDQDIDIGGLCGFGGCGGLCYDF
jgi:hypothetical protein